MIGRDVLFVALLMNSFKACLWKEELKLGVEWVYELRNGGFKGMKMYKNNFERNVYILEEIAQLKKHVTDVDTLL